MLRLSLLSGRWSHEISDGTEDLLSFIDYCRTLDLDGVDFNTFTFKCEDKDYLREVKLRCLHNGLSVPCLSIGTDFGVAETEVGAQIEHTKRWIDHAQFIGAPQVRIFAGSPASGESHEAAWARAVRCVKEVADYGYERGVLVALQNHNHFHRSMTRDGDAVLRFIEEAGPHLGHVWDTGQYEGSPGVGMGQVEDKNPAAESVYESLQKTVHLATHVRAKIYRIASETEAALDYPRIFSILCSANYNGFVSIAYEGVVTHHREAVPKGVAYLRSLIEQRAC
jgi:sugar phosphate isomerase/epimerase